MLYGLTMTSDDRPLVVVLFGGQSGEHQVSAATAGGILRAIDDTKWRTLAVGIAPTGEWVPQPNNPDNYALGSSEGYTVRVGDKRVAFLPGSPDLVSFSVDAGGRVVPSSIETLGAVDIVFPVLHGPFGEDGTVQGLFEMSHVRYVGCGVTSSAICQDKYLTKTVLEQAGIDVGEWVSFTRRQWEENEGDLTERISALGYPIFVKPCRAGSSLGISKVADEGGLRAAVLEAQRHDPRIIVEAASTGREVECGVLARADGTVQTSIVGEIKVLENDFYDYKTKYFAPDAAVLECPADLPGSVVAQIQDVSRKAFAALEGEGISRVDFFYDDKTGRLVLNEVNTMPGFTPFSMYPVAFQETGVSYKELVSALLEEAAARPLGLR